jgi:hypothetical protein
VCIKDILQYTTPPVSFQSLAHSLTVHDFASLHFFSRSVRGDPCIMYRYHFIGRLLLFVHLLQLLLLVPVVRTLKLKPSIAWLSSTTTSTRTCTSSATISLRTTNHGQYLIARSAERDQPNIDTDENYYYDSDRKTNAGNGVVHKSPVSFTPPPRRRGPRRPIRRTSSTISNTATTNSKRPENDVALQVLLQNQAPDALSIGTTELISVPMTQVVDDDDDDNNNDFATLTPKLSSSTLRAITQVVLPKTSQPRTMTKIQMLTYPIARNGTNLIGQAPTGTGKVCHNALL